MGNSLRRGELDPPPMADREPQSIEVLRVWACKGKTQEVVIRTAWPDPAYWGLLLADVARHAALAYKQQGHDAEAALDRILKLLLAELQNPTDEPNPM